MGASRRYDVAEIAVAYLVLSRAMSNPTSETKA